MSARLITTLIDRPYTELSTGMLMQRGMAGGGRSEAHRHPLDAGDGVRSQPLDRSRELDIAHSAGDFIEHYAHFESRQIGAQAKMLAVAEGHVVIGRARDVEALRIVELGRIAIRREVPQNDAIAGADRLVSNRRIAGGDPHDVG